MLQGGCARAVIDCLPSVASIGLRLAARDSLAVVRFVHFLDRSGRPTFTWTSVKFTALLLLPCSGMPLCGVGPPLWGVACGLEEGLDLLPCSNRPPWEVADLSSLCGVAVIALA